MAKANFRSLLGFLLLGQAFSEFRELTAENFNEHVFAGKNALVEFCAPWCAWCKQGEPKKIWDSLAAQYNDSSDVLVASLDCGSEHFDMSLGKGKATKASAESLLQDNMFPGNPTEVCRARNVQAICDKEPGHIPQYIYFTPQTGTGGHLYAGERDLKSFDFFIKDRLVPICNLETKKDCSEQDLQYVEKQKPKDYEKLSAEYKRLRKLIAAGMTDEKKDWAIRRTRLIKVILKAQDDLPRLLQDDLTKECLLATGESEKGVSQCGDYAAKQFTKDVESLSKEHDRLVKMLNDDKTHAKEKAWIVARVHLNKRVREEL
eukprot:TRINITY_DN39108_c0_g1_i1.p1 TRINITY_DN39108_c0_g1~~TRINITY_DN39108_c0_g1_i1.p1  ORF type:complete len:336 (+),score=62.54 TRINITY_DN39108_c0_g1_i1:57-1010(+)